MIKLNNKLKKGFTLPEMLVAMLIASFLVGGLFIAFSEAVFYFKKEMYRENVEKYSDTVMNNIFSNTINASFVNIENKDELILGYRTNNESVDSFMIYQHRPNQGILVNGNTLENSFFHNKDQNKNYYMYLREFSVDHTFDGQGYDADLRDAIIEVFLGIELYYKRGDRIIKEEFPYKKTIFTRSAAAYNSSKEFNDE